MIYLEIIMDNKDTFRIERQKNKPNGNWTWVSIYETEGEKFYADNEDWLLDFLEEGGKIPNLKGEGSKIVNKLIKKADKLGWFDEIKKSHSVVKF